MSRACRISRAWVRGSCSRGARSNLAAVKAEVDFIRASFVHAGVEPDIVVHRYAGEAGGIGAALEAIRTIDGRHGHATTFIGLDAVRRITFETQRGEETRCRFCTNDCLRTFIDVSTGGDPRRVIVATCEKGAVEDLDSLRAVKAGLDRITAANPDFVDIAGREVWKAQPAPGGNGRTGGRRAALAGEALRHRVAQGAGRRLRPNLPWGPEGDTWYGQVPGFGPGAGQEGLHGLQFPLRS